MITPLPMRHALEAPGIMGGTALNGWGILSYISGLKALAYISWWPDGSGLDQHDVDMAPWSLNTPNLGYLQNLTGCPVCPQIVNLSHGCWYSVPDQCCSPHSGLSGSLLIILIWDVWSEIEGLEYGSLHGVKGDENMHGVISNAYADGVPPSRGYVPTQV